MRILCFLTAQAIYFVDLYPKNAKANIVGSELRRAAQLVEWVKKHDAKE